MIYTDLEKIKVSFSTLFVRHYPELYKKLSDIMWNYHKGYGALSHTKDYWVRDFMPIQMDENTFVKFIYNPDYLQDKKKFITDVDKVIKNSPYVEDFKITDVPLVVDGGNMVFCKGLINYEEQSYIVMTEKVFVENPQFTKKQIELLLICAFQEPHITIVWLPWDKQDPYGHTDGIVRYVGINDNGTPTVLVNLELYDDDIAEKMYSALSQHFEVIELQLSEYDELSWAYINCLQTADFIIIPGIGNSVTDAEALAQYKSLFPQYGNNIYQVQMRDFVAENGGALNCLTWTVNENYFIEFAKDAHISIIGYDDMFF